jgi:hypothetical protein
MEGESTPVALHGGVTLTIIAAAGSLTGMALSSPGQRLMSWLVVLFAAGTLLGHVCVLEPGHPHLGDPSAGIGSAGSDSGGPVTIDEASCESLKPASASAWSVMRAIDNRSLPAAGLAGRDPVRVGRAASASVRHPPLFVLHAALLI